MRFNSDLIRGIAEPIIMRLLRERDMYGYEIIKIVNERSDGAFEWKEGSLYPCLHRLEAAGTIESEWSEGPNNKQRKYYRLTKKGKKQLSVKVDEWASFSETVDTFLLGRFGGLVHG